jgi:hypothetical protein
MAPGVAAAAANGISAGACAISKCDLACSGGSGHLSLMGGDEEEEEEEAAAAANGASAVLSFRQ